MKFSARCFRRRLVGLGIVMNLFSACATVGSERVVNACPPVVEYSRAEQARAADEISDLPEGAILIEWMADYSVLQEQTRSCVFR